MSDELTNQEDHLLRIGEIAAFFNVSVKAMRIYERMGIITPAKIDAQTGYRYYSPDQVRYLDALLELKKLGFSLAEIKALFACGMSNDRYMEALVHKKADWQDKIAYAETQVESIGIQIEALKLSRPAAKAHELTEDERALLLSRMSAVKELQGVLSEALWV